jgi:hypothetical protein
LRLIVPAPGGGDGAGGGRLRESVVAAAVVVVVVVSLLWAVRQLALIPRPSRPPPRQQHLEHLSLQLLCYY